MLQEIRLPSSNIRWGLKLFLSFTYYVASELVSKDTLLRRCQARVPDLPDNIRQQCDEKAIYPSGQLFDTAGGSEVFLFDQPLYLLQALSPDVPFEDIPAFVIAFPSGRRTSPLITGIQVFCTASARDLGDDVRNFPQKEAV